jgi:O-succinylbenzoic acid--CoA ligase
VLSIPNPLLSAALARPEHIVLRCGAQAWSAQQLLQAVRCRAQFWAQSGIQAGETVGLWGRADAAFVIDLHALGWLGAAAAPLAHSAPDAERQRAIEALGCKRIIVGPGADAPTRRGLHQALGAGGVLLDSPGAAASGAPMDAAAPERFWPADEVRLVVLSSGSTAAPHAVRLTTAQLFFSAVGSATRLGHHVDDVWLLCLPLHHVGGLSILFRAAFFAASVTLVPRFVAADALRYLADGRVSLVSLVPQMLSRMLDLADDAESLWAAHPRLRAILLGGAPPPQTLLERSRARQLPVCVTWGMTETASQVATTWPGAFLGSGDCGPPLPFARVSPVGDAGILHVTGPVAGPTTLATQDWGQLTAQGRVVVQGRCDDILISGGENIAPFEVESVLLAHPLIADAAVVGISDAQWGQRPVAVLVGTQKGQPGDAVLAAWCRDRLASFKIPAQFIWCQSLPRDALGKLRRKQVQLDVHQGVEDV